MDNSEMIRQALKPDAHKKSVCGICFQELEGLFRDHSMENCSMAVTLQRDRLLEVLKEVYAVLDPNRPLGKKVSQAIAKAEAL